MYDFQFMSVCRLLDSFLLRSLSDELHELSKLWSDDNLRAAVALLASVCSVLSHWVVLAASAGCHALRVNIVLWLEALYDA